MAYMMKNTTDPKWQVEFEWYDPKVWVDRLSNQGEPKSLRREQVPTRAFCTSKRAMLPDSAVVQAWVAISHRLRSRIASLEPDRNQYFAFDVARKNGKPVLGPDGEPLRDPYYLINTTTRFDAVMIEKSGIDPASIKFGLVPVFGTKMDAIVLDRRMTAGHHVWEGVRHFTGRLMVSDELGDWILANRMKSVELTRLREG